MCNRVQLRRAMARGLTQDALDQYAIHRPTREPLADGQAETHASPALSFDGRRGGDRLGDQHEPALGETYRVRPGLRDSCEFGFGLQPARARESERGRGLPWFQTARRLRPLARRAFRTARPPRDFMRTRKPCVRLRFTTEGWKVRLVAMAVVPGEATRNRRVAKEVVAAETARFGRRCFAAAGSGIASSRACSCGHERKRSPIGEKPRIRRDKARARQTAAHGASESENARRRAAAAGLSTACQQVVQNHPYRFATPFVELASRERTLSRNASSFTVNRAPFCEAHACRAVDNQRSPDYNSPFVDTTIAMSVPAVSASRKRGDR